MFLTPIQFVDSHSICQITMTLRPTWRSVVIGAKNCNTILQNVVIISEVTATKSYCKSLFFCSAHLCILSYKLHNFVIRNNFIVVYYKLSSFFKNFRSKSSNLTSCTSSFTAYFIGNHV